MNDFFPLALFPSGAFTHSVLVTVWVGIWVVTFLNLRFGLTLSGLVVPGYLVPLLIVKPISAGVVLFESYVTYFLALALASGLMKRLGASEMFGRDRFFALVLISILVRVTFDGWLLPIVGEYLVTIGIDFDYRNNLQSFGLIIVALIANQMWNGGARRGTYSLILYLAISYVIIRFIVMNLTNFSITNLSFMYEDIASSILATPKAYIILLTTAFIASRMNLHYGWEFNGILIPSLLALQWYEPGKLLVTFIEAFIIFFVGRGCLKLPFFAQRNMEGARLLLFFFNIGFIYKYLLSYILLQFAPQLKISDYFAFGYLLSTLLALKMHTKDIPILITRATLQISAYAVLIATVLGYSLTVMTQQMVPPALAQSHITLIRDDNISIEDTMQRNQAELYLSRTERYEAPTPGEQVNFEQAIAHIGRFYKTGDLTQIERAAELLQSINYDTERTSDNYLVISDKKPQRAGGVYAFNLEPEVDLTVQVPAPLNEQGIANISMHMFVNARAKVLAFAGSRRQQDPNGRSDVLTTPRSFFQIVHEELGNRNVIQVRGYTREMVRQLYGIREEESTKSFSHVPNRLWVKNTIPPDLDPSALTESIKQLEIVFETPALPNRQREYSREGFAEIMLNSEGMRQLVASFPAANNIERQSANQQIDGYLQSWLVDDEHLFALKNSELYIPPKLNELIFIDEQILTPLMQLVNGQSSEDFDSLQQENLDQELSRLNLLAQMANYHLILYKQIQSGDRYLILSELDRPGRGYRGTFIFRINKSANYIIEVPRPLFERSSLEYSINLFQKLNAKVLIIAGSHAFANSSGESDMLDPENKVSMYNLVHQTVLRSLSPHDALVIQARALGANDPILSGQTDALLSIWQDSTMTPDNELLSDFRRQLEEDGLRINLIDGGRQEAGYESHFALQSRYLAAVENSEFVALWLAPELRRSFQQRTVDTGLFTIFSTMEVTSGAVDLTSWVRSERFSGLILQDPIKNKISQFLSNRNIVMLASIQEELKPLHLKHITDQSTQQSFLAIMDDQKLVALANIAPLKGSEVIYWDEDPASLNKFLNRRSGWLLAGAPK